MGYPQANMPIKVLLIEDDHTMITLLRTLLRIEGFEVALLESDESLEAILASIRKDKPDVALLDVHLRQVNGLDLLYAIREDPECHDMHVIMSSGIDFGQQCLDGGADAFILKPYMPEDLISKLRQVSANGS